MKKQLLRAAASTVLGLSLTTGFAAADINTTGPLSNNTSTSTVHRHYSVRNYNDVSASNSNYQNSATGNASSSWNTTAGGATTGAAANNNNFNASATLTNNSAAGIAAAAAAAAPAATTTNNITNTGPGSTNVASSYDSNSVKVVNDNDLSLTNSNNQTAKTGNANVSFNTTGGSAVSGSATNTNSSSFTLNVSN